jgi:hypothetical protein
MNPTKKPHRGNVVVKAALSVLLTSAVLLLPTVRAQDATGEKSASSQLSSGEIKAQRQFKMLDFNQDGKLSRKEVSFIPKLAAAFDETDTNKDGFVTYEEVRAYAVKYRAERGLDKAKTAEQATPPVAPVVAPVPEAAAIHSEAVSPESESK